MNMNDQEQGGSSSTASVTAEIEQHWWVTHAFPYLLAVVNFINLDVGNIFDNYVVKF